MIIKYTLNTQTPFTAGTDLTIDGDNFHYAHVADADFDVTTLTDGVVVDAEDYPTVVDSIKTFTNAAFDIENGIITEADFEARIAPYGLVVGGE